MGFGIWQLLLLLAVILVLFGSGKLPNAIKDIGKGIRSMKDEFKGDASAEKPEASTEDEPEMKVVNPKDDEKR